jgi:hypothetical protein
MKYILTESKLKKVFFDYFNSEYKPHTLKMNEESIFDWGEGVSVDAISFESEDGFSVFDYYPEEQSNTEDWSDIELESLPTLIVYSSSNMRKVFGDDSLFEDYIKEWFELTFGQPVKTVYVQ